MKSNTRLKQLIGLVDIRNLLEYWIIYLIFRAFLVYEKDFRAKPYQSLLISQEIRL